MPRKKQNRKNKVLNDLTPSSNGQRKKAGKKKSKSQRSNQSQHNPRVLMRAMALMNSGIQDKCVKKYFSALTRPFSSEARGCCVPQYLAGDTFKDRAIMSGAFKCGTQGFGFIAVSPSACNDVPQIVYSDETYAGTTIETNTATVGVSALSLDKLTPTYAELNQPGASCRIVAAGLLVYYTGTVLNLAGKYYALSSPNRTLLDGYSVSDLSSNTYALNQKAGMQTVFLPLYGVTPDELAFNTSKNDSVLLQYPFGGSYAGAEVPVIAGVIADSLAGNQFSFEYIVHTEVIGTTFNTLATPSHSNEKGAVHVRTAVAQAVADMPSSKSDKEPQDWFASTATANLKNIANEFLSDPQVASSLRGATVNGLRWATGQL